MAIIQNQEDDQQQQGPIQMGGAPQSGGVASSQVPVRQKGSGRFTNLQKYIQANTGAGQQIGSRIGSQFGREFEEEKGQAQTQAQQVAQGIQAGKGVFGEGGESQQIQQQLQGIGQQGYDAQQFVQQPEFQRFQTIMGRMGDDAFSEQQLREQQAQYVASQQAAQQAAQQRGQLLGTEQGVGQLLRQSVGQPGQRYTTGQQRLDQLFLQTQPGDQIGQLQSQTRQQQEALQQLGQQYGELGGQIEEVAGLEDVARQQLGETATGLESGFIGSLQDQLEQVNQQRLAEQQKAQQVLAGLQGKEISGLDEQEFWDIAGQLGLEQGEKTFGALKALKDPFFGVEDIADFGLQAQNYQDIATQEDVAKYGALAQLAGITDPTQMKLTQAGDLGQAVKYKEGTVQDLIDKYQQQFQKRAGQQEFDFNRLISGASGWGGGASGPGYLGLGDKVQLKDILPLLEQEEPKTLQEAIQKSIKDPLYKDREILGGEKFKEFARRDSFTTREEMQQQIEDYLKAQKYYETFGGPKFKTPEDLENPNVFGVE